MTAQHRLLVCPFLLKEVVAAAADLREVDVEPFALACRWPRLSSESSPPEVAARPRTCPTDVLASLGCVAALESAVGGAQCKVHRFGQCLEPLAGKTLVEAEVRDGAYLVSPGWLAGWRQQMSAWKLDQATARELFHETATRIVLLDTGVDPAARTNLGELSEYLALPSATITVGLDYLRMFVTQLALERGAERSRDVQLMELARAGAKGAGYAAAFDLIDRLTGLLTESEVIENTLDVFTMLYAPEHLVYVPLKGGAPGRIEHRSTTPPPPGAGEQLAARAMAGPIAATDDGFVLSIEHHGSRLGVLEATRLAGPASAPDLDLAATIGGVCGLAIANARKYDDLLKADAALALERERLAVTLHSIGDAVVATDTAGHVVLLNGVAEELTGWTQKEALGVPFGTVLRLIHQPTGLAAPDPVKDVLASGSALELSDDIALISKDGAVRSIADSAAPIRDTSGRILGVVVVFRDTTEKVRIEQAQRFLADASGVLASSLDRESTLADVARVAVPALGSICLIDLLDGSARVRRVGTACASTLSGEVLEALRRDPPGGGPLEQVLRSGEPVVLSDDGSAWRSLAGGLDANLQALIGPTRYVIAPLLGRGQTLGTLTLATPSSETSRDMAPLPLVQEFARRCGLVVDNARLFRESREAVRGLEDFLSMASHDLRSPISALQLHLDLMSRRTRDITTPQWVGDRVRAASSALASLTSLLDTLLDVSRIRAGRLRLDHADVDLSAVARDVAANHAEELARAGSSIVLRAEESIIGRWDRVRLVQITTNLVTNAIKYGGGEPIEVTTEADGPVARLIVRDHGLGIAPEDQGRIFDQFERAGAPRNVGGLGVGLWIVRRVTEALGGSIHVTSEPGKGATFTLTLPRMVERASTPPPT